MPAKAYHGDNTIGVLMGGMSAERDISLKTGTAICNALQSLGYRTQGIDVGRNICTVLAENPIDTAFIALHGRYGEDGSIQGLLELLQIPYTGSGVLASALAMNKPASKKMFCWHGLPTPDFMLVDSSRTDDRRLLKDTLERLQLPCIVKPAEEGSTIGVSIVHKAEQLSAALTAAAAYGNTIIVEAYISGRELTVGVLNSEPLPLIEIKPRSGFYDYSAKYTKGETDYIVSPDIDQETAQEMQRLALRACSALGCRGACRADFILSGQGTPYVLEINTIPGMTETSLLPMAAKAAGISFSELIEQILSGADIEK